MVNAPRESLSYGVKYQARCISAQYGGEDTSRFIVGTAGLREENEIHIIQYEKGGTDLTCEGLFTHQHEIWDLASCPFDSSLFSTVYAANGQYFASIWRFPSKESSKTAHSPSPSPSPSSSPSPPTLHQIAQLKGIDAPIKCLLWHPNGNQKSVISLDLETIRVWDLNETRKTAVVTSHASVGDLQQISCGKWDVHDDMQRVVTCSANDFNFWDLRTMQQTQFVDQAHSMKIRDVDFNPNKPHSLMTCGDDSKIKFWDLRNLKLPFWEVSAHPHWVWQARYNPFYDNLVLSCGTDCMVKLWQVEGSTFNTKGAEKDKNKDKKNDFEMLQDSTFLPFYEKVKNSEREPLQTFAEHEDSVYGISWSRKDPFLFASLSYDGRVNIHFVNESAQSQCKY